MKSFRINCKNNALPNLFDNNDKTMRKKSYSARQISKTNTFKAKNNIPIIFEPSSIEISGFLIGEKQHRSLLIQNISSQTIQIEIYGQISCFFDYKCSRKVELTEKEKYQIRIYFIPSEYKIYKSFIKIVGEDFCRNIDIIAFPVINQKLREILPQEINFKSIEIGDKAQILKTVYCEINLDFEFKVKVLDDCPELKVFPLMGIVKKLSEITFKFEFAPKEDKTYNCEIEVILLDSFFAALYFDCEYKSSWKRNRK